MGAFSQIKISETGNTAILHFGNIRLWCRALCLYGHFPFRGLRRLVVRTILGDLGSVHRVAQTKHSGMVQDADNVGRIGPGSLQRTAIQSAACGFHHADGPVLTDLNGLSYRLPVSFGAIGRSVVKYIPLPVDAYHTAVAVSHRICRIHELSALQTDIT